MKKVIISLLVFCLTMICGTTAYAEIVVLSDTNISVVEWVDNGQNSDDTGNGGNAAFPVHSITIGHEPANVETVMENGIMLVKKSYEVPHGFDPQTLVQPFEQDGYSFEPREILSRELPGEILTRPASKAATAESDTDKEAEVLKHFPATIDHEEDGYIGQLHLDGSTFKTEANKHESYTYPTTKTREYPGLSRNDPSFLDKEWNGMILSGVSFKQGYDGLYTATASYKGTATGKRATGFITTATYYGEISKPAPGNIIYTVVYEGVPAMPPIVLPAGESELDALELAGLEPREQEQKLSPKKGVNMRHIILIVLICVMLGAIITVARHKMIQKKREEQRNEANY